MRETKPNTNTSKYQLKNLSLINTSFLLGTPLLLLFFTYLWITKDGFDLRIVFFSIFTYILSGISITAGYHRLFAHKTYDAHPIVKLFFLIFGATAFQNSVLKWASDHRLHHSKVDTDHDPYNINEGFFFAHMGWVMLEKNSEIKTRYSKDMEQDSLIMWQHKYYLPIAFLFGFILPTIICYYLFGTIYGGIASCLFRVVFVHHCTFFINSLCHCFGSQPYTDTNTAKDNWFMAYFTFGEGYHNFHHYFQTDYRNGISWYDFDPTKWLIKSLDFIKLATNLKVTSKKRIMDAKLQMSLKRIEKNSTFADYQAEFEEMKIKILEAIKNIDLSKKMKDKDKLAKEKLRQAKKDLHFHLILWKLHIKKLQQNPI